MHIFLYLREGNEFYTPLIKAINVCCDNHIGEKDVAVVLQDLVAASQYVLATAWARVKLEGAHGMSDDKRIDKQLKKKYTVPQPNYCPDNISRHRCLNKTAGIEVHFSQLLIVRGDDIHEG